jgi:hypothetical protein
MVRRALAAAVGVLAGLAPTWAPAAATSEPVTGDQAVVGRRPGAGVDGGGSVSVTAT